MNGYLRCLSQLDSVHGVNTILVKLPYNLQEKWVLVASKFKRHMCHILRLNFLSASSMKKPGFTTTPALLLSQPSTQELKNLQVQSRELGANLCQENRCIASRWGYPHYSHRQEHHRPGQAVSPAW